MRIAILGTRGVPNYFGGFEQCAEKVGIYFVEQNHDVTVYSPDDHAYKEALWNGIKIRRIYSNERRLKFLNSFVLDYLSLKDAVNKDFDIILELGYSPCALFYYLKKRTSARIVTNMAGLEWKRSKWNYLAKKVIIYTEKLAIEKSDALISDNYGIRDYIRDEYGVDSFCITYGAELYYSPKSGCLDEYGVKEYQYYMMVARFQPDNNFEMILDGYVASESNAVFLVVGNCLNKYGSYLKSKYDAYKNIRFVGGIYNYDTLSSLRWFSKRYFHGHSCGGTNPSLLEAMASNAYIAAHDNVFNRYVLDSDAAYFRDSHEVTSIINDDNGKHREEFILRNREKIKLYYNWAGIGEEYLRVFKRVCSQ